MLAKFRVLLIAVLALVAVPETIFADDSAKVTALEELLRQYMDENAELKKVIAEQGANEPDAGADVVVDETAAADGAEDGTVRLELYSSEIICERAHLNDKEYGNVVKMDAKKYADEAERRGLNCADEVAEEANAPAEGSDASVRLELYSSEIICERAHLNDKEYGLVVKMDAQKYADEAKRRGLNCADGSKDVNTKVDKVCRSNLTDCSDEVLCELSTHNDGSVKWRSGLSAAGGYIEFVNEAQARGLDCGVENAATSTNESYTCEDNPASCNAQHLCEFVTTRTGSSVTWSSDPASRPYVDEARKQQLACSLTFPLASCKGWNGTVNVLSGINSTKATMTGHVLAKDLKEYCTRDPGGETTNYGGKLSIDQCVAKYLAQKNDPLKTTANCETGELVHDWYWDGESKVSKETFPLSAGTDRSCASGLMQLEYQFAMLCPKNADSDDWIAAGQQRKADAENHKADAQAAEQKRLADERQKKVDADAKAAEKSKTRRFAESQSMCNLYYYEFSNSTGLTVNNQSIFLDGIDYQSLEMNHDSINFSADNSTKHAEAFVNFVGGDRFIFQLFIWFNGIPVENINNVYVECN